MVKEDLECDYCFKKVDSPKDLRKTRYAKMWKCKECQEKDKKRKNGFSCYIPFEMLEAKTESGAKLIGVKSPQGQFIALNKVLDKFMKPFMVSAEFVAHIQDHLTKDPKLKGQEVMCKICNKTIDQIWDESQTKRNGE